MYKSDTFYLKKKCREALVHYITWLIALIASIFRHSRRRFRWFHAAETEREELDRSVERKSPGEEWGNFISARPRLHVTMNESVNKRTSPSCDQRSVKFSNYKTLHVRSECLSFFFPSVRGSCSLAYLYADRFYRLCSNSLFRPFSPLRILWSTTTVNNNSQWESGKKKRKKKSQFLTQNMG